MQRIGAYIALLLAFFKVTLLIHSCTVNLLVVSHTWQCGFTSVEILHLHGEYAFCCVYLSIVSDFHLSPLCIPLQILHCEGRLPTVLS